MLSEDTLHLMRVAAEAALDKKAFQLVGVDVSEVASFTDGFLICSGAGARQVSAIADGVGRRLREAGRRPMHVEGTSGADWILLDFGDLIVHVFTEARRDYYALDGLWRDGQRIDLGALTGAPPEAVE